MSRDRWSSCRRIALFVLVLIGPARVLAGDGARSAEPSSAPVISREQIEADWLREEAVRYLPPSPRNRPEAALSQVSTVQDAAGGCDGIKNGTYGFHTGGDVNPWWQVDLGASMPLGKILIYNRGDGNVEDRAARLRVLLSADGKGWTTLYEHNGSKFSGHADGKPLAVEAAGAKARFVRIQLPGSAYLHLDEVEVYRQGATENVALRRPADQSSVSPWSTAKIPA